MSQVSRRLLAVVALVAIALVLSVIPLGGNTQPAVAQALPQSIEEPLMPSWGYTPTVVLVSQGAGLTIYDSAGYSETVPGDMRWRASFVQDRWVVFGQYMSPSVQLVSYDTYTGLTQTLGVTGSMPAYNRISGQLVWIAPIGSASTVMSGTVIVDGNQMTIVSPMNLSAPSLPYNPEWGPDGQPVASGQSGYTRYIFKRIAVGAWQVLQSGTNPDYPSFDDAGRLVYHAGNTAGSMSVFRVDPGGPTERARDTWQPSCSSGRCIALTPANTILGPHEVVEIATTGLTRTLLLVDANQQFPTAGSNYYELPQPIVGLQASCNNAFAGGVITCTVSETSSPTGIDHTFNFPDGVVRSGSFVTRTVFESGSFEADVSACNRYGCVSTTASYAVWPKPVAYVTIATNPSPAEVNAGNTVVFTATGYADDGMAVIVDQDAFYFEASGGTMANNQFSATVAGNYVLTATVEGISGTAEIHVGPDFSSAMAVVHADPDVQVVTPTMTVDIWGSVADQYGNAIYTTPYQFWRYTVDGTAEIDAVTGFMTVGPCADGDEIVVTAELRLQNTVQLSGTRSFLCEVQVTQHNVYLPLVVR